VACGAGKSERGAGVGAVLASRTQAVMAKAKIAQVKRRDVYLRVIVGKSTTKVRLPKMSSSGI